jgi:hypothetical protein
MSVIMNFFPSSDLILILLLLFFNAGITAGEGNFFMTVNQSNIIEGHIAFDITEGKEKIRVNFTQRNFMVNGQFEEQSEEWLLLFDKHKTYSIDNVTKTFRENYNSETFDKIMKEKFNLDREEKSVFYKSEIAPGKIASFSKINELSEGYIMRIKDKNLKNLITSMEIRGNDAFIHVDFFLSSDKITSEIFNIPEGYKKAK